jgi:hypothetical protein
MSVGCAIVQLGGSLVILVVRSVVITSGHFIGSRSRRTCCGTPPQACKRDLRTPALVLNARLTLRNLLFRYVPRQCDGTVQLVRAAPQPSGGPRAWCFLRGNVISSPAYVHGAGQSPHARPLPFPPLVWCPGNNWTGPFHGLVAQTIVFRRLRWQATENDGLPHCIVNLLDTALAWCSRA